MCHGYHKNLNIFLELLQIIFDTDVSERYFYW